MNEQALLRTLTRVVTALTQKDIAFAVAGGCAVYARGGPVTEQLSIPVDRGVSGDLRFGVLIAV
ncbi:hypothetical protein [Mycobacteroides abscessus]|uniref:hypothetical protein n=1 Tax=Mycobacteroides abscessus TaxID=36809 RepID=UPI0015FF6518|nr:hypothetical protein [Mycobacteroides abscessus]